MPRIPRKQIVSEGSLFHVTWQCHNKDFLLKPHWAKKILYRLLLKHKDRYKMTIFSYIIMDNHLHISGKSPSLRNFSRYFQVVHTSFAKMINKRNNRIGQVIRDRFKSPLLQNEKALFQEMIYHDLNEVRCGKSNDPGKNELSSYPHYAFGKKDHLLTEPDFYIKLGKTPKQRQNTYRIMVLEILVNAPRKKDGQYTEELFVGDPIWVKSKYKELKSLRKRMYQESDYLEIQKKSKELENSAKNYSKIPY